MHVAECLALSVEGAGAVVKSYPARHIGLRRVRNGSEGQRVGLNHERVSQRICACCLDQLGIECNGKRRPGVVASCLLQCSIGKRVIVHASFCRYIHLANIILMMVGERYVRSAGGDEELVVTTLPAVRGRLKYKLIVEGRGNHTAPTQADFETAGG